MSPYSDVSSLSTTSTSSSSRPLHNQKYLDSFIEEKRKLSEPRIGIMSNLHIATVHANDNNLTTPLLYSSQDLCHVLHENKNLDIKAYFHPNHTICKEVHADLNIDKVIGEESYVPRTILLQSLQNSAQTGGDKIASNGYCRNNQNIVLYIRCQCAYIYEANSPKAGSYRQDTYVNNRRNNRPGNAGKHGKKRTDTIRTKDRERTCPFYLSVYHDTRGFYVKSNSCNVFHKNHAKRDHIRQSSKLVPSRDRKEIRIGGAACAASSIGMNMHYIRTKERTKTASILSQRQIRYICDDIFPSSKDTPGDEKHGEIDNLYEYLRDMDYPHVSLLQSSNNSTQLPTNTQSTLYTETNFDGKTSTNLQSDCHNDQEAILFSDEHRKARKISDDQKMMVAIAYSSPFQLKQAKLFPTVLHIDVTADTNKEDRPFCSITAKDSNANFFTVVQCFLPNEKGWSFKWFFQSAVPFLVTRHVLQKCNYVITDGDQTMIQQLEDCIQEYMPWAKRGRCSWHIIDRGWATHVKLPLGGYSRKKRSLGTKGKKRKRPAPLTIGNKLSRIFYRWMFSWADSYCCMDEEEFHVSKAIMFHTLKKHECKEILGINSPHEVMTTFYNEHVLPHIDRFLFYNRKDIYHLDSHTNCGIEGCQNGVKNSASPCTPLNRLDNSVYRNTMNAKVRMDNKMIRLSSKCHSTKNWSTSPTSEFLTDIAESIITNEWKVGGKSYQSTRTSRYRWLVAFSPGKEEELFDVWSDWLDDNEFNESNAPADENTVEFIKKFGIIPKFARAYEVTYNPSSSCLECSCGHWNRLRIPCRHLAAVVQQNDMLSQLYKDGFPMSSVSVKWMNDYYYIGMNNFDKKSRFGKALDKLVNRDSKGLYCPNTIEDDLFYNPDKRIVDLFKSPAKYRILNYPKEKIDEIFKSNIYHDENTIPMGLSQESFNYNQIDQEDTLFEDVLLCPDPNRYVQKTQQLTSAFYVMINEITKSGKLELCKEVENYFDRIVVQCREDTPAPHGRVVSSHPPNSKRRRAQGISNML